MLNLIIQILFPLSCWVMWHVLFFAAIFPRWRKRSEEGVPGEKSRAVVPPSRSVPLHSDHRHTHQDLCHNSTHTRCCFEISCVDHMRALTDTQYIFILFCWTDVDTLLLSSSVFIHVAFTPVHDGKGIRLTPSEKIQPSRGRCRYNHHMFHPCGSVTPHSPSPPPLSSLSFVNVFFITFLVAETRPDVLMCANEP